MPIIRLSKLNQAMDGTFDRCSVLVELDNKQLVQLTEALIDPADLTEDGIETDPHVTVLYGLLEDDPFAVSGLIKDNWKQQIEIEFGKTMIFEADDYDVVVIEIISDDLQQLHELIRDNLPNELTHPDYQPHLTLAYVKSGVGTKYDDLGLDIISKRVIVDQVVFSSTEGDFTEIPLIN